jgi:hypothetical protein
VPCVAAHPYLIPYPMPSSFGRRFARAHGQLHARLLAALGNDEGRVSWAEVRRPRCPCAHPAAAWISDAAWQPSMRVGMGVARYMWPPGHSELRTHILPLLSTSSCRLHVAGAALDVAALSGAVVRVQAASGIGPRPLD